MEVNIYFTLEVNLNKKNFTMIIDTFRDLVSVADGPVKFHDGGDHTVDFLRGCCRKNMEMNLIEADMHSQSTYCDFLALLSFFISAQIQHFVFIKIKRGVNSNGRRKNSGFPGTHHHSGGY